jgi:hypothetical protein
MLSVALASAWLEHSLRDFKNAEKGCIIAMEQFTSDENLDLKK